MGGLKRGLFVVAALAAACTRSASGHGEATPPPSSAPPVTASAPPSASLTPPAPKPPLPVVHGGGNTVRSERGVVVSVESQATRAGVRILEAGGNAVDAAVAVAYALAVTHPSAGNIGGGGFMLVHRVGQPTVAIDFRETAPEALTRERFDQMIAHDAIGPDAAGIPGTVAGLELAHDRFGKLSREDVLAPAIELAEKGHRIGHREGLTIRWSWPSIKRNPPLRAVFGDGKDPKKAGTRLRRPDLAKTLRRIAEQGRDGFYQGETAKRLIARTPCGTRRTSRSTAPSSARRCAFRTAVSRWRRCRRPPPEAPRWP